MLRSTFLLSLVLVAPSALAQPPSLSGTWELIESRSEIDAESAWAGLVAAGAPGRIHVTHPPAGALIVESEYNPSSARHYVPGKSTTTGVFLGEAGTVTVTTRIEGESVIATGHRESPSSEPIEIRETLSMIDDGATLRVALVVDGRESVLRYARLADVGPCESWASPCKVPQQRSP